MTVQRRTSDHASPVISWSRSAGFWIQPWTVPDEFGWKCDLGLASVVHWNYQQAEREPHRALDCFIVEVRSSETGMAWRWAVRAAHVPGH